MPASTVGVLTWLGGALLLAAPALVLARQTDVVTSTRAGAYSPAQAERGERLYGQRCALCHQPEQYVGETFMKSWSGQTVGALFGLLRTTMPKDNPGSLKSQEYADLIAYILKLNGLPAGDRTLKGTARELEQVVIEAPEKAGLPH